MILPGIEINYGQMRFSNESKFLLFVIKYCQKGRIEWNEGCSPCHYLESDEIALINSKNKQIHFEKTSDFSGFDLCFYSDSIEKISQYFPFFQIDLQNIFHKFLENHDFFVLRNKNIFSTIFSKLNQDAVFSEKKDAIHLALLELLLYLKNCNLEKESPCINCNLSKFQQERIRKIGFFICDNLSEHYTVTELSNKFGIQSTNLKACFKQVFGLPIYTFTRKKRMEMAAKRLIESDDGILRIAGDVGYCNGSKFAHAFQDVMGISPKDYRRHFIKKNVA